MLIEENAEVIAQVKSDYYTMFILIEAKEDELAKANAQIQGMSIVSLTT